MNNTVLKLIYGGLVGLILGCSARTAPPDNQPTTSFWESINPQEVGIDSRVIDSIHHEILNGQYGLIDHFLLIRNGKVVFDHQYQQDYQQVMLRHDTTNHQYNYDHIAWHPYFDNTHLHTLQSVTKSITSILLGIAVDEGFIPDIDSSAMSYFSSHQTDLSDERKIAMSIYDLLTMQSGIEWDEEDYSAANNSCILMEGSEDWIRFILDQPMDTVPGAIFEYNSGASVLLGKIVREATGKRIDQWAEEKLFEPLGIEQYYWKETPLGEVDTEGGLYLTSYDLAKIGYLMLNLGEWEGRQIVSTQWVKNSLTPHVSFNGESGYGFQWWIPVHDEGRAIVFAGNGYGGQFLQVVPQYDLIVVFNGWNIHDRPEKSSWRALQQRILPAVQNLEQMESASD